MNDFDFWQKWGLDLEDQEFADAFTALGILSLPHDLPEMVPLHDRTELLKGGIVSRLNREAGAVYSRSGESHWVFPRKRHFNSLQESRGLLDLSDPSGPKMVAEAWRLAVNEFGLQHLKIVDYPKTEPIRPWYRLLSESKPGNKAVHINLDLSTADLHLKWPLRLGFLPGNDGERIVQQARSRWPSDQLASTVRIDRENANCDVLLFTGSVSQLLKKLLDTPVPQKTNLVIVRGTFEEDPAAMEHRLLAVAAESRASGFVFLNPSVCDDLAAVGLNNFIVGLSHNQFVDFSLAAAFTVGESDPIVFLSRGLAGFRIEYMLEALHCRMAALPKEARLNIEPETLLRMDIPLDGAVEDLTIPENTARKIREYKSAVRFDREMDGALGAAKMSTATDDAEGSVLEETEKRFLQEQVYMKKKGALVEERRAFLRNVPTLIRVRIGPSDERWVSERDAFPEEKLPKHLDKWRLTVVLTEPNHLKKALRSSIELPRTGPSTECEFRVKPGQSEIFEGQISVLHRGRILQTAVLIGSVVNAESTIPEDARINLVDKVSARLHIGDLKERRQFDLSIVLNRSKEEDRPRLTAISSDNAWCGDLSGCKGIIDDINKALSGVAGSVREYSGGIDSEKNRELLITLARLGYALYWSIVEEQLNAPRNRADIAGKEYVQIVSTKGDAIVPLEFIYDLEPPGDNAKPCKSWKDALTEGSCRKICRTNKADYVCPLGFWGIRKVIERHDLTPELAADGKEFFLQSEPTSGRWLLPIRGVALAAASARVKDEAFAPVLTACNECLGASERASDWKSWEDLVQEYGPHLLLALTHTDGRGIDATLEIGSKEIKSILIRETHVRKAGTADYPLVALLGCDTAGTAMEYGSHVRWFRRKGAAVVIGTIATVFGGHAAKVAEMLVRGLKQGSGQSERLGEVVRSIKRQALLDGMLMPLCIVAYGDADWKLK